MSMELDDFRVLAALRFTDAVTGLPIDDALIVSAPGVRWLRNRRSCWVMATAPGFDAYESAFDTLPAAPATGSVNVSYEVSDPAGRWLPRLGSAALPRDAEPAHAAQPTSVFTVTDVSLYPSPAAPVERSWAVVRGSVRGATPSAVLAGALVRVVRSSDGTRIGAGISDARGEALIAVKGIPSSSLGEGDGPVTDTEIAVRLEVVWNPSAGTVVDPDALEARRADLLVRQATARLASGRVLAMTL